MKRRKRLDHLLLSILCFLVCLFVLTLQGCGGLSCPRTDTAPERVIDVLLVYDTHETNTREFIGASQPACVLVTKGTLGIST